MGVEMGVEQVPGENLKATKSSHIDWIGVLRWAAPVAVMGGLFAVGAVLGLVDEVQKVYRSLLKSAVHARWAAGDTGALSEAALLLMLWVLWLVTRKMALFAAFYAAERALPSRSTKSNSLRFALAVQLSLALLYATVGTFLLFARPISRLPEPMVNLRQAEIEFLVGPFAPIVIALAALLVYDFIDYWVHRAWHHFPFLWRFHSVHHSIEHVDSLNSYAHPIDLATATGAFIAVSLLIGFSFDTVLLVLAFRTIQGRLVHTSAPVNFGPLGAVLVDNRTHFLHHTREGARSGKNFAGTFTIFDRLFGTYERPGRGPLAATGLEDQRPPRTVLSFFMACPSPTHDATSPAGSQPDKSPATRI